MNSHVDSWLDQSRSRVYAVAIAALCAHTGVFAGTPQTVFRAEIYRLEWPLVPGVVEGTELSSFVGLLGQQFDVVSARARIQFAVGNNVRPGCYEYTQTSGEIRMEVIIDGSTCPSPTRGRFRLHEVEILGTALSKLALDFGYRCDRGPQIGHGSVRINSAVPLPASYLAGARFSGRLQVNAQAGALGPGIAGTQFDLSLNERNFQLQQIAVTGGDGLQRYSDGTVAVPTALDRLLKLSFSGIGGGVLRPGTYALAGDVPICCAGLPGTPVLALYDPSVAAETLPVFGQFTVRQSDYGIAYGDLLEPVSGAIDFDQRWGSSNGPRATGTLEFSVRGPDELIYANDQEDETAAVPPSIWNCPPPAGA